MDGSGRRRFSILAATIGLTTFGGCLGNVLRRGDESPNRTDSSDGTDYLGALSKAGPGGFSNSDDGRSGWVHTVANGETYAVTFDVRICHESQSEVAVELYKSATGEYTLSFATNGGPHSESDCNFGTHLNGSGSIPTDFESLNVDVNGETLRNAKREGTFARLHPLPDPIDAR